MDVEEGNLRQRNVRRERSCHGEKADEVGMEGKWRSNRRGEG